MNIDQLSDDELRTLILKKQIEFIKKIYQKHLESLLIKLQNQQLFYYLKQHIDILKHQHHLLQIHLVTGIQIKTKRN